MKCLVENCNIELRDLSMHISKKHNMSIEEYKQKYNVVKVIDEDLRKKRSDTRKSKYLFECKFCTGNEGKFHNEKALIYHYSIKKDLEHNHELYNGINTNDWVECNICKYRNPTLIKHIQEHNLKSSTYTGELYSFNKKEELKQLKQKSRDKNCSFKCPIDLCNLSFLTENSLNQHLVESKDLKHNHFLFNDNNHDDWIECKICRTRKNILEKHLKNEHSMTCKEYKAKFNCNVYSKNYHEYNIMNFAIAGSKVDKSRLGSFMCSGCKKPFSSQDSLNQHIQTKLDKKHTHIRNNDDNQNEWVECMISGCNIRMSRIDLHLNATHKMTKEQYKEQYNLPCFSKSFIEKSKNNAKLCHGNDKVWKEKKLEANQHAQETKQKNSNFLDESQNKVIFNTECFINQKESCEQIISYIKDKTCKTEK